MNTPQQDPRIAIMRRIVIYLAWFVGLSTLVATVFGFYTCVTERPAREIFMEPEE